MRNLLFLLVAIASLFSCQEEVKFNDPAVQAQKDGVLWRAIDYKATATTTGKFTITAVKGFETLVLRTNSYTKGTYTFTGNISNYADFDDRTVGSIGNYSTSYIGGSGQIVITEFSNGTISGNFKFNAVNTNPLAIDDELMNFKNGVFYKIPVTIIP